jgi:DNA helicase-2/ATP-dependent DNA helicase PcrA
MNINSIENSSLLRRFDELRNGILVDSLAVARRLFPNLESHKLGDLLNEFGLEGVNSHNALDDVKATASLVHYMIDILRIRLEEIDSLVDSDLYRSATFALSKHWCVIDRLMRAKTADGHESELHDSLTFWIDYSYRNGMYNDNGNRDVIENEIEEKLIPFLKRNNYKGLFNHIMDETQERAETLYTLKESDLISDEHKVVVSTVHRAKGLEFDTAIVPQVTGSNYPSWSPPETSTKEIERREAESRRLLYVALSRPRNKLLVSYHKTYKPGPNSNGYPKAISPFIEKCIDEFSWTNLKKH